MSDSDNDDQGGINLTGFLFGNIDEKGELENDFLDEEAKKHLSSLPRYVILFVVEIHFGNKLTFYFLDLELLQFYQVL